jgi:non-specific serine/threonine protein kinase
MDSDPFQTQRDVGSAIVAELSAAGFADAEEIGRGGFGIVFQCHQVALDRTVAVKVLTAELHEDRERFLREQRAMGRLTGHPNIIGVLEVGETGSGYPYLVMQYHRQGSLDARIKRLGRLPLEEVLRLGVKMSAALESAHRLQILHRDIKPANILLTDFGEPALCDFGIAHIAGGFKTATGTFTGSPAFTAPEILTGDPPTMASDVYGLGATLFAALTGHAAYERKSGEQVVAQFLRIASEPVPDLRDWDVPDDIAAVVAKAMSRDADDRPSAVMLGEELQRVQAKRGLAVDEMPLRSDRTAVGVATTAARQPGNLRLELTSFIGRQAEVAEVKKLLSTSRLVTVTGIGGVGKTRLALRAAVEMRRDCPDGVWVVELGEVRDPLVVTNVTAGALGVRDESGRPLREVLLESLCTRRLLIVLDNCEQVVDEAAKLSEALLQACPNLRILATSRERLGIGGEAVLGLLPLALPEADRDPTLRGLPGYDAVALFADRAAAALPGFALTEENKATVARICCQVDGLPLAIELAAARLRAMSPEQILERLADRFTLLARGNRAAPTRQQTLGWSIDWSYDLCTPTEQKLWARVSVFAGSFAMDAAEDICNGDLGPETVLDVLASLVDKSILIRVESNSQVRFRFLDTVRDYGRGKLQQSGEYRKLRKRQLDWYRRLVADAAANWFSSRQVHWVNRIAAETHNLRDAFEFAYEDAPQTLLEMSAALHVYAVARGHLSEMRRWLDRALAATPVEPSEKRIKALYAATVIACFQGDPEAATSRTTEATSLVEHMAGPVPRALVAIADAFVALIKRDSHRALTRSQDALAVTDDPIVTVPAMTLAGWALEFRGELGPALVWQQKALAIAESAGEVVYRSYVLWAVGVGCWRNGQRERAERLLRECLKLAHLIDDPRNGAACLEALAWIASAKNDPRRAVVLMAAAAALGDWVGVSPVVLPDLLVFHQECERGALEALGSEEFGVAQMRGFAMDLDGAIRYALDAEA